MQICSNLKKILKPLLLFVLLLQPKFILAKAILPQSIGKEQRFKIWTYYPNTVFRFEGFYGHPSYIEFGEDVQNVSASDTEAWEFELVGKNRLFLKPKKENADMTMLVLTKDKEYPFELTALTPIGPFDDRITFYAKFRYNPTSLANGKGGKKSLTRYSTFQNDKPNLAELDKFNFNYTVAGDKNIMPIKIFDNNKLTYLEFDKESPIPAAYEVNQDGFESLVNYKFSGDYMIIEGTFPMINLRYGPDTVCIFNEIMSRKLQNNTQQSNTFDPDSLTRLEAAEMLVKDKIDIDRSATPINTN